jgi:hypothetical protein
MSHQAHKRIVLGVCSLVLIALLVAAITQAAVVEQTLSYEEANCRAGQTAVKAGSTGGDTCGKDLNSPEPFTVLVFGIGLAGAGFAIRRQFVRA